jgi:hypothetical protein
MVRPCIGARKLSAVSRKLPYLRPASSTLIHIRSTSSRSGEERMSVCREGFFFSQVAPTTFLALFVTHTDCTYILVHQEKKKMWDGEPKTKSSFVQGGGGQGRPDSDQIIFRPNLTSGSNIPSSHIHHMATNLSSRSSRILKPPASISFSRKKGGKLDERKGCNRRKLEPGRFHSPDPGH